MMQHSFEKTLLLYDYALPKERIALTPTSPRDSAKLVMIDRNTGKKTWTVFRSLPELLPKNAVLVLNETKVIPAQMVVRKSTGGSVEILALRRSGSAIAVLANRKLRTGEFLTIRGKTGFTVRKSFGKEWLLQPSFPMAHLSKIFERYGNAPLPPYLRHSPLSRNLRKRSYQTVIAKHPGSIAAPTASLHFTKRLMKALERKGIRIARVTLHVHLGTFSPLTEEQWKMGKLHEESYAITPKDRRTLERAKREGCPIVAVGTTVARTLESAANSTGQLKKPKGRTRLFIREDYRFRFVDALITNFHVPRSSLLMLVGAFMGREKLMAVYAEAIRRKLRFFSFGDAMLIV